LPFKLPFSGNLLNFRDLINNKFKYMGFSVGYGSENREGYSIASTPTSSLID